MFFDDYIKARVGETVDFDGYYGFQCVDFIRDFASNVLKITIKPKGNAKPLFFLDWGDEWEKHTNTPDFLPKPGDVCIWDVYTYGHIGVVVSATLNEMIIIDQNTGSGNGDGEGDNAIRVQKYSYKNVLGFIRYKQGIPVRVEESEKDKTIEAQRKLVGEITKERDEYIKTLNSIRSIVQQSL